MVDRADPHPMVWLIAASITEETGKYRRLKQDVLTIILRSEGSCKTRTQRMEV